MKHLEDDNDGLHKHIYFIESEIRAFREENKIRDRRQFQKLVLETLGCVISPLNLKHDFKAERSGKEEEVTFINSKGGVSKNIKDDKQACSHGFKPVDIQNNLFYAKCHLLNTNPNHNKQKRVFDNNVVNNCIDIVGAKRSKVDVALNPSKTGNANTESVFTVSFMWQI